MLSGGGILQCLLSLVGSSVHGQGRALDFLGSHTFLIVFGSTDVFVLLMLYSQCSQQEKNLVSHGWHASSQSQVNARDNSCDVERPEMRCSRICRHGLRPDHHGLQFMALENLAFV